jgi:Cft2 family RNA processing exonuclease
VKIRVLGGAREVGGSCIAVETENCKVALDYGIKLDGVTDEYPKNFDAVIISHAHLDHSGSLLRLTKVRKKQTIVGSRITRDITIDLLKDMIKIQNEKAGIVAFDDQAANTVRDSWLTAETLSLTDMNVTMYPAGHVAGAKMLGVSSEGKTVIYTGDFCIHDTEILEGCNINLLPREPELLISESTYGGKVRPPRDELTRKFLVEVSGTMKRWGNILIPTFAFHRSQEMAKRIDRAMQEGVLPNYNAYVISKLGSKVTTHFNAYKQLFTKEISQQEKPFDYKYVKYIERTSEIEEPAIVVCTSGFGHAGASLSLLELWAEGEENTVILTSGFLPADSPLRFAKEKRWFRAVEGDKIPVHAKIVTIELSGHADQIELIELVTKLKPKKTVLVHGDLPQADALSEKISQLTEVCIPEKNETIIV